MRRAARTAIVMPAMFAVGEKVIGNPTAATFAAFGAFAMCLLVDFGGPMRERLEAMVALACTGAVLLCLGTVASPRTWLAVVAMALVGFAVLFAGVVSSVLAGASTSLILAFILAVSLPGGTATLPDRLAGWGLAAGATLIAIGLLWPAPREDPLRGLAAAACRALAARLRSDVAYLRSGVSADAAAGHEQAIAAASAAVSALHRAFLATPYRPTGLSTPARATVRLVDELSWINAILTQSRPVATSGAASTTSSEVKLSAATVLDRGADLLHLPERSPDELRSALLDLSQALTAMERGATVELPVHRHPVGPSEAGSGEAAEDQQISEVLTSLDPSFRAQELSFAVGLIGRNVDRTEAAEKRGWWDRVLGHQPEGLAGTLSTARERAAAHVEPHSVWLHNSLRGGAALALAVLVAKQTGVQHGFWVVFGTWRSCDPMP